MSEAEKLVRQSLRAFEEPRPGTVFVRVRWTVTGAGSGIPLEVPMYMAVTIRDGKIRRTEFFQQEAPARAAAGI